MEFVDDTPSPGALPDVYPKQPPINLLPPALLSPTNFFAFEGIDGSGKSSLIARVTAVFKERGLSTQILKLGRSDVTSHALERAKWLNANPMTFSLLNWVSLFEQATQEEKFNKRDARVIVDRYILTLKVRGILEGLSRDFMEPLEKMLPRPSVLFFIDCDPDTCCQRILASGRQITYFEAGSRIVDGLHAPMIERDSRSRRASESRKAGLRAHLHRMRSELKRLARSEPNVVMIDNSGPPEDAIAQILRKLEVA
jgi:thymidylate kinase